MLYCQYHLGDLATAIDESGWFRTANDGDSHSHSLERAAGGDALQPLSPDSKADAVRTPFDRHRFGHPLDRVLGRRIDRTIDR